MNKTRLDLLDSLPKGGICAELGVFTADFSRQILQRTSPWLLYMVDLFDGVIYSGDENGENGQRIDMGIQYTILSRFFATKEQSFWPVQVVKGDSAKWLLSQPASSLDWIYIDSSHEYHHTARELEYALVAVKGGGFICGHDYSPEHFPGVVQAVNEFIWPRGWTMEIFDGDRLPSFKIWVKK